MWKNSDGLVSKTIIKYDGSGNETEIAMNNDNDNGDIQKFAYEYIYEYKYDFNGNWIEKITYDKLSNTATEITERIIEYQ